MITKDKEITLSLRTADQATRELILGSIGELKVELSSSGFQLNNLSVMVQNDHGEMQFSSSSQGHNGQMQEKDQGRGQDTGFVVEDEIQVLPTYHSARAGTIHYRI